MNASDIAPIEEPRLEPPPPDPTAERCHLLGPTALIVQALMGVFVIGSLVVKRHLEKRKRPWRVWTLDVAKQLVGQGVIHALNILVSARGVRSELARGPGALSLVTRGRRRCDWADEK